MFNFSLTPEEWTKIGEGTIDTLYMLFVSGFFMITIGILIGITLYLSEPGGLKENRALNQILSICINILRSVPFIILIVIMMPVTKIVTGKVIGINAALPTLIISMAPFYGRIIHMALREVNLGVIEAARSMGASTYQVVTKVLFPEAKPAIISGTTIAAVTLLANSAVAGVTIGAGGLGAVVINDGYENYAYAIMWAGTLALTVIVFAIQIPGDIISKKIDKR